MMKERGRAAMEPGVSHDAAPWRANLDALFTLLDESRRRATSPAEIAAIIAEEAGEALSRATIGVIADRVSRAL